MAKPKEKTTSGGEPAPDLSSICLTMIGHAPMPMAAVQGPDHIVRYVNPSFCQLMGKRERAIVGKPFREMFPESDDTVTILDRVYRTGKPIKHSAQHHSSPNSSHLSYTLWPVKVGNRATGVVVQVAETAQLYEETLAMNEALILGSVRQHQLAEAADASSADLAAIDTVKNHFIAVLSHELRSPLNTILLWSQILQRPSRTDDALLEGLRIIYRSSKTLTQFIDDLLDVHRISSGKMRLDVTTANLAEILRSVVDSMAPAATEKDVRIVREIEMTPVLVSGDPARLEQVLGNLLGNAIKFTPKGGEIRVVLSRSMTHVELKVCDTGEGISAAVLPHIFERFRQDDHLTGYSHGGLGLGLEITKHLVQLHGGTITAESPGKGGGATFTVSLPSLEREGTTRTPTTSSKGAVERPPSLDGILVLVVDDEPDTRAALRLILEEADAVTMVVGSADEALHAIKRRRPNVIVSDIGMPGRDGYELLRAIRVLPATQGGRIPAVALTAYATSEDRDRALRAGFQVHLAKPVEPAKLISAIASLASHTRPIPTGRRRGREKDPRP